MANLLLWPAQFPSGLRWNIPALRGGRIGPIGAPVDEFRRCNPLQRRMRTRLVKVLASDFDFASGVLRRQEPMRVEAFLPETSVEGFVLRVVGWLARREKSISTPFSYAHLSNVFEMTSLPLSALI